MMSFAEELKAQLELPVIASPMFIISNPRLVAEQCKNGIVGSFPALNARPAEVLEQWLQQLTTELAEFKAANPGRKVAPFAVNQIVHHSNDRLEHDLVVRALRDGLHELTDDVRAIDQVRRETAPAPPASAPASTIPAKGFSTSTRRAL